MGEVIETMERELYLRHLGELAQRTWGERLEIHYEFNDRQRAGRVSRWLRKETRLRSLPLTVRQYHHRVFVWKKLSPDDEEKAMAKAVASIGLSLDGKPGRHLRSV